MSSGGAHYCESNTDYNIATTNRLNATITNDAYDIADDHSGHSGDNSRQHTAEEDLLSNNTTLTNQTSNATNVSPSHLQASGGVRYSDPTIANLSLFATNGGHQEGDGDEDGNSDQPHEENISTSTRRRQVLLFHHPADRAHYLPGDAATPAAATAVVGESQQHQEDDASYDSDTNFTLTEGLDLLTGSTVNNDGGGGRHSARNRSSVSSKAGGRVAGGVRISPTTAATAANNRKTHRDAHKMIGDHSPSSSLARKQKAVTVNRDENDRSAAAEEMMSSGRHDSYYHDAEDDESTRGTDGGLSSLTQFIHRTLYENPTATNADDSLYEDPDATGNESTTTGSATAATMTDEYPNSDADDNDNNEGADGDEENAYTSRKRERDEKGGKGKEKGESVVASGTTNRNKSDLVGSFDRAETESTQFEVPLKFGDVDDDEDEEEELPSFSADEDEDEDSEQQQQDRSIKPADVTTIGTNKNTNLKKEKGKRNGRGRRELLALAHEDRHVGDDADGDGSGTDSSSSSSSSSSTSSSSSDSSQEESLQQQKKRRQQRGAAGDCYVGAKGDDEADSYFSTYSDLDVHKLMLSDGPRMKFYSAVLADSREKSKATVALGAEEEHNEKKNKKEGNTLYGDGFHGFTPAFPHQEVTSSSSSSATADKTASTVDKRGVGGGIVRGSVVVEVGCGSGVLSVWAAKYGRARRVIAFEGSTAMATLAAEVAVENGLAVGTAKVNPHDEADADFIVRQLNEDEEEDDTKHEEKSDNSPSSSSSSSSSSDESSSDNDEHEEVEADTLTQFDPDSKHFGRSHFAFNSNILPQLIVVDGISDVVVDRGVDAFIHRFLKNEKHTGIRAPNSDYHEDISDKVPYLPVSVVYSEWMGFYLLHECMLPSVIRMRIFLESVNAEVERRNNDWLLREREESPSSASSSSSTPTVVRSVRYGPPAMVPNKATLYVSPVSLQPFYQDRYASFWGSVTSRPNPQLLLNALAGFSGTVGAINCSSSSSSNGGATSASLAAHKLKMLSIARLQFESLLETVETSGTPLVELLPHSSLLCRPKVFADIDLQNCSVEAALECVGSAVFDFSEAYPPCAEAYPRSAHVDGFCVWFDVSQETDPTQPSFAAKALATTTVQSSSSASETTTIAISPPVLPTGPTDSPTHWKQSTLLIPSSMRAEIVATTPPPAAGKKGQIAARHQTEDNGNEKKEKKKKRKQEKGEEVGEAAIHPLSLRALVASRERMKVVISIKRTKGRQYAVDFELEDASNNE